MKDIFSQYPKLILTNLHRDWNGWFVFSLCARCTQSVFLTLQLSPQGSNNGDHRSHTGGAGANTNGSSSSASTGNSVSVPTRVHQITQHYMSHVHNLVQCHELWEQADQQAAEFPGKSQPFESVSLCPDG